MNNEINFAVGFVTGRETACEIINAYYLDMLNQIKRYNKKVNLTIYILYDVNYQNTHIDNFYKINKEVYDTNIKIRHISEEDINNEKINILKQGILNEDEVSQFLGHGHAKCRNTLMYFALKEKTDYLLFWDDDEYPYAVYKNEKSELEWFKQDNILEHLNNIEDVSITQGYHCGYISPIPYVDYTNEKVENTMKKYINSISNDILNWDKIKDIFEKNNGITYTNKDIIENKIKYEIEYKDGGKWVAGSVLCLNLNKLDTIPAFYNPLGARGEDTFFSTMLNKAKVLKIPLYHFHDGFLKCKEIMKGELPENLIKITSEKDQYVEKRFLNASRGWIKYKPLYVYITDRKNYDNIMSDIEIQLKESIYGMNEVFKDCNFNCVLDDFKKYSERVESDYKQYKLVNEVWIKLKEHIN